MSVSSSFYTIWDADDGKLVLSDNLIVAVVTGLSEYEHFCESLCEGLSVVPVCCCVSLGQLRCAHWLVAAACWLPVLVVWWCRLCCHYVQLLCDSHSPPSINSYLCQCWSNVTTQFIISCTSYILWGSNIYSSSSLWCTQFYIGFHRDLVSYKDHNYCITLLQFTAILSAFHCSASLLTIVIFISWNR